jgi:hypothetical protein
MDRMGAALNALETLQKAELTLMEVLNHIVDGHPRFQTYRKWLFSQPHDGPLRKILTGILNDDKGGSPENHA